MIRKKHSTAKGNKKYIKLSYLSIYFFSTLLLVMTFVSGYFFGKSNKKTIQTNTDTVQQAQPQAQQQAQQPATSKITMEQVRGLFENGNITFGDKNSKLIFVEFSDPSCPFCHVAAGKNRTLNKQMGNQFVLKADGGTYVAPVPEMKKLVDLGKAAMVWVYANGHGSGEMGTKALYCAQEKGKFWQVHDLLMNDAGYTLMNTTVKNDKAQSGVMADFLKKEIDANFMKSCLESGKYDSQLTTDMATARQFGFSGTPSFFINTQNFAGAYSWSDMKSVADGAL